MILIDFRCPCRLATR